MRPDRVRSSAARLRELATRHTTGVARTVEKVNPLSAGAVGSDAVAQALRGFLTRLREVGLVQGRKLHNGAAAMIAAAARTTDEDKSNADILDRQHRGNGHDRSGEHDSRPDRDDDRNDDRDDRRDRDDDRDDERSSGSSSGSGKRVRR
jgi:chromosome condensin MukBEF MukE localization factor